MYIILFIYYNYNVSLLLFFFSTPVLGNSQKVINYFNNVQMETIEGIWMTSRGSSFYIIKEGIEYSAYMIDSPNYSSGAKWMNLYKNSETFFLVISIYCLMIKLRIYSYSLQ